MPFIVLSALLLQTVNKITIKVALHMQWNKCSTFYELYGRKHDFFYFFMICVTYILEYIFFSHNKSLNLHCSNTIVLRCHCDFLCYVVIW